MPPHGLQKAIPDGPFDYIRTSKLEATYYVLHGYQADRLGAFRTMTDLPSNSTLPSAISRPATGRSAIFRHRCRAGRNTHTTPANRPRLAWHLAVDARKDYWREHVRARVNPAIPITPKNGTTAAVRQVVVTFGGNIALCEWFEQVARGTPGGFDVVPKYRKSKNVASFPKRPCGSGHYARMGDHTALSSHPYFPNSPPQVFKPCSAKSGARATRIAKCKRTLPLDSELIFCSCPAITASSRAGSPFTARPSLAAGHPPRFSINV